MLFNSLEFIFIFLPMSLVAFYGARWLFRGSVRPLLAVLLVVSLFFYGYWNADYLWLLAGSVVFNYGCGELLRRYPGKGLLAVGVTFNILLLGIFKYTGFLVSEIGDLFHTGWSAPDILLPLAISFFTFQQIAYLVDCYRGQAEGSGGLLEYAVFVSFFPQLIAGPIVRHSDVAPQFRSRLGGRFSSPLMATGITLFVLGLFKKIVIADSLAPMADRAFGIVESGTLLSLFEAWAGLMAFTLQIYFDFSGYTDMALGLAAMFGISLPMNFRSPYKAQSIIDFWRRWHITLSTFLRDYVYIPLGGSRGASRRRYVNLLIVMLIGGLWHGAGWTFVLWGGAHGLMLCLNHLWIRSAVAWRPALPRWAGWVFTFIGVALAWVLFRAETLPGASAMYASLAGSGGVMIPETVISRLPGMAGSVLASFTVPVQWDGERVFQATDLLMLLAAFGLCLLVPRFDEILSGLKEGRMFRSFSVQNLVVSIAGSRTAGMLCGIGVSIMLWVAVLSAVRDRTFLYFQF
ncbi:MAG: MBOAT family protein [Rhodospirillales bacterium]